MKKLFLVAAVATAGLVVSVRHQTSAFAQGKDSAAAPKAASAPQKIAIIDLSRVFAEASRFQQMQEEFRELQISKQQKAEQMSQKAQSIAQDVKEQNLEAGSDEYVEKEQELIQLDSSYKTFMQVAKRQLGRRQLEIQAQMHSELMEALERFGETNGYALILNAHELSENSDSNAEIRYVMQQTVSWHRDQQDITSAVIEYLNQQTDGAQVKAAGGGAADRGGKAVQTGGTKGAAATTAKPAPAAGGANAGAKKPAAAPQRKAGR